MRDLGIEALVVDACPVVLAVLDGRPEIVWANAALRDLAQPWGDVVGRLAWDLLPVEIGMSAVSCLTDPHATPLAVPEQSWRDPRGQTRRIAWSVTRLPASGAGSVPRLLATGVDVTVERRHQATWRERAYTDPLTGLANRAAVCAALERCLDVHGGEGCALILGDLDGLKLVNDERGHAAGDAVLRRVADRVRELADARDVVARIGGDEFVVIMPGAGRRSALRRVALLAAAFGGRTRLLDGDVEVGVSLGLHVARPGEDPDTALHLADMAMYAEKRRRKAAR